MHKHLGTSLSVTYVFVSLEIIGSHWGALSSKIQEALGQLHDAKKNIYILEAFEGRMGTKVKGERGRDYDSQGLNRSKIHCLFA